MTSNNKKRPTVGVATIIIKDQKILLGKRAGKHGYGSWSVPGGYLEFGETFEECSIRETFEETGIKISNPIFYTVINNIFHTEPHHSITIFMAGRYKYGTPKTTEPDKFTDVNWYDLTGMPEPLFLPVETLLKTKPELFA